MHIYNITLQLQKLDEVDGPIILTTDQCELVLVALGEEFLAVAVDGHVVHQRWVDFVGEAQHVACLGEQ